VPARVRKSGNPGHYQHARIFCLSDNPAGLAVPDHFQRDSHSHICAPTCYDWVPNQYCHTPTTKQVYLDIPYLQEAGVDPDLLSLDIYTPASNGAHPVIVMIHGGSWRSGNKGSGAVTAPKPQFFTNNGFVFISINYRLSPAVIYPEQVEDVAAALAWVHQHIGAYGGDPWQLYVMGHSAGGQLAALVATDDRYLAIHDMKPSDLSGVILLDAAGLDIPGTMSPSLSFTYTTAFGNDPETWKEASPINYVAPDKGIPPFLVCYTFQVVPFTQSSQEFASLLAYAGVKVWSYAAANKNAQLDHDDVGTLTIRSPVGSCCSWKRLCRAPVLER